MAGLDTPDWTAKPVAALAEFASELGYAFQLCDDLLGVYGDAATFGKPLCSDFREGKPTVLYLEALERLTESGRAELAALMKHPAYTETEIAKIRTLLEECGARAAVVRAAEESSDKAMANLSSLPENKYRSLLEELAEDLLKRNV